MEGHEVGKEEGGEGREARASKNVWKLKNVSKIYNSNILQCMYIFVCSGFALELLMCWLL